MATRPEPRTRRRLPLNRDRVLRAALALADAGGLETLTMRKLGRKLGVEAMSLYNHVANKEDIIDGMVDLVFSEIDLPASGADWKTAMRDRAIAVREALSRHRWAIGLMESRRNPGPATLRHHDAVIGSLRLVRGSGRVAICPPPPPRSSSLRRTSRLRHKHRRRQRLVKQGIPRGRWRFAVAPISEPHDSGGLRYLRRMCNLRHTLTA